MNSKLSLGEFVSKTLAKKGLTLRQVFINSRRRLKAQTLQKIKDGDTTNPRLQTVDALADGIGENYEMLCRIGVGKPAHPGEHNGERDEMLQIFEQLGKRGRKEWLAMGHFFLSRERYGKGLEPDNNNHE